MPILQTVHLDQEGVPQSVGPRRQRGLRPHLLLVFPKSLIKHLSSVRAAQDLQRERVRPPSSFIFYLLSNIFSQYEQHIDLQREKLRLPLSFIFYLLSNISSQYEQHIDLQREKLRLLKTEFEGIKDDLDKHGDKYVDKYLDKGAWRSWTVSFISSGPKRRSRYKLPRQVCFISISLLDQRAVDHISGTGRILQTSLSSFWVIRKPWLFWTR